MQISGGENFGEFGETNVIGQYLPRQILKQPYVKCLSYWKLAKVFLAKTLK